MISMAWPALQPDPSTCPVGEIERGAEVGRLIRTFFSDLDPIFLPIIDLNGSALLWDESREEG
jgi:hypothetical protein